MKPPFALTHKEAVRRVSAWLANSNRCNVVFSELSTRNSETPDAIGFHDGHGSILIECKMSRADFLADKKKHCRRYEEFGMGDVRYFAAPSGILQPDDLPAGWGLLEISEHRIRVTVEPTHNLANKQAEVTMLVSAIRRLQLSTAVFVRQDISFDEQASPDDPRTDA